MTFLCCWLWFESQITARTVFDPSKPLVSRLEGKLPENSLPLRQLGRARQQLVEWRNLIVTGPVLWLFVRSGDTRNPRSCWSASCPSSVWFVRSLRTSRLTCVSRALLWWLCKKPARPTLLVCLWTPTCAPSTPSVSPSCPRTSSSPAESVENAPKLLYQLSIQRLL